MKFIRGTLIFISKENSKMSLPSNEGKVRMNDMDAKTFKSLAIATVIATTTGVVGYNLGNRQAPTSRAVAAVAAPAAPTPRKPVPTPAGNDNMVPLEDLKIVYVTGNDGLVYTAVQAPKGGNGSQYFAFDTSSGIPQSVEVSGFGTVADALPTGSNLRSGYATGFTIELLTDSNTNEQVPVVTIKGTQTGKKYHVGLVASPEGSTPVSLDMTVR